MNVFVFFFFLNMNGMRKDCENDLEKGLLSRPAHLRETIQPGLPTSRSALFLSNSGKALVVSNSTKSFASGFNSEKRLDKKKYVKQVTGRHNDTEIHLAAQRGDVATIRQILAAIDDRMTGIVTAAEFEAEVSRLYNNVCMLMSIKCVALAF